MLSLLLAASLQKATLLCSITDERVNESSGLASSLIKSGVFYTHNDSGDSARFFRFSKSGQVTGVFTLSGVTAFDWEDMAAARVGKTSYLYFGDFGDNARVRKSIAVHRVKEPDARNSGHAITDFSTFNLAYPDQARDCEAMFVRSNGDMWFITKAREGETVAYMLAGKKGPGSHTLTKVGYLEVKTAGLGGNLVTAADVSPDGMTVALRTYSSILLYRGMKSFGDWWNAKPTVLSWTSEKQGEALSFSKDGKMILTSSEGTPCPVSIFTLPAN